MPDILVGSAFSGYRLLASTYTLGHPDGKARVRELVRHSRLYKESWEEEELPTPTNGFYPNKKYLDLDDWRGLAAAALKAGSMVRPVYLYDHSGLAVSLSNTSYPFTCPWDSGQVGLMVWSREQREKFHGGRFRDTKQRRQKDKRIMESYFSEWAEYVSGDVYSVMVLDPETEKQIDCCGDLYGWEYATGEALEQYCGIDASTLQPLAA